MAPLTQGIVVMRPWAFSGLSSDASKLADGPSWQCGEPTAPSQVSAHRAALSFNSRLWSRANRRGGAQLVVSKQPGKRSHNQPLERTAAAVYFTCGRA